MVVLIPRQNSKPVCADESSEKNSFRFSSISIDFLGEYDAKCETALGRESLAIGGVD
jgi:hypothetical protein